MKQSFKTPFHLITLIILFSTGQAITLDDINRQVTTLNNLPESVENTQALTEWRSLPALLDQSQILQSQLQKATEPSPLFTQVPAPPELAEKNLTLSELNAHLNVLNAHKEALQIQLQKLDTVLADGNTRLSSIPTQLATARQQLAAIRSTPSGSSSLSQATHHKNLLETKILRLKIELLEQEQDTYSQQRKSLPLTISETKNALRDLDPLIAQARTSVTERQKEVALQASAKIEKTSNLLKQIPAIAELLNKINELNEERNGSTGSLFQITETEQVVSTIVATQVLVRDKETLAKNRLALLEQAQLPIDAETGLLLRNQRSSLPQPLRLKKNLQAQLYETAQVQLRALTVQQELTQVPFLDQRKIDALLSEHPNVKQASIDQLLSQHQHLLNSLSSDYTKLEGLLKLSTATHSATVLNIQNYSRFIDERLLWIKSAPSLYLKEPAQAGQHLLTLSQSLTDSELLPQIARQARSNLFLYISLCITALILFFKRTALRGKLERCGLTAARRNCTTFSPTFLAIFYTLLLALPLPAVALLLEQLIPAQHLLHPGFHALASVIFPFSLLFAACLPHGLFVSHLRIPAHKAALLRKNLCWFIPLLIPLVIIVVSLSKSALSPEAGRLLYIFAMGVIAALLHQLLKPSASFLISKKEHPSLALFAYYLGLLIPLTLALLSAFGYFYSALTLRIQLLETLGVAIVSFLVIRALGRWILVSKRALSISQALRRREAALAEQQTSKESGKPTDLPSLEEVKAEAVNVVEVEEQTIGLVKLATTCAAFFAIWAIWSSSLPALGALDNIHLWGNNTAQAPSQSANPTDAISQPLKQLNPSSTDSSEPAEASEATADLPDLIRPSDGVISLQDVLLSLAFLALTIIAARNIPGLLSLTVFSRIQLGQGGNFALTTTVKYIIITLGIVITLGKIGITWSNVQWIAAAVTLGIGFGLQEVFANFVAGIILLYERPIRICDVVTIGDITGKVTKIQIRATTLRQLNNRDLVVPNKEFITGKIINWSLDDSTIRVEAPVGVAYGSDLTLVKSTLLKVAQDHPIILDSPAPDVVFTEFGDSSLNFILRGFIAHPDNFVRTKSALLLGINTALQQVGVEIPFPQRDLHIKSSEVPFPINPRA